MQFQPSSHSYGASVPLSSAEGQRILAEARAAEEKRKAGLPTEAERKEAAKAAAAALTVGVGMLAFSVAGTFFLWPMVIKEFKPDWSYKQRLMGGFFASAALSALYRVGRPEEKD